MRLRFLLATTECAYQTGPERQLVALSEADALLDMQRSFDQFIVYEMQRVVDAAALRSTDIGRAAHLCVAVQPYLASL